jgi:hypothetical protein
LLDSLIGKWPNAWSPAAQKKPTPLASWAKQLPLLKVVSKAKESLKLYLWNRIIFSGFNILAASWRHTWDNPFQTTSKVGSE